MRGPWARARSSLLTPRCAGLQLRSLCSQKEPRGLGIKEQIVMNKTSGGRFSAAEINELSNKYEISQILKFTFQGLVPLHGSPGGAARVLL